MLRVRTIALAVASACTLFGWVGVVVAADHAPAPPFEPGGCNITKDKGLFCKNLPMPFPDCPHLVGVDFEQQVLGSARTGTNDSTAIPSTCTAKIATSRPQGRCVYPDSFTTYSYVCVVATGTPCSTPPGNEQ